MQDRPATASGSFGVFLSYARSDGEAFAKELRQRLNQDLPNDTGCPGLGCDDAGVTGSSLPGPPITIKLWDPTSPNPESSQPLFVADAAITALAFLPASPTLVAGDASGRLHWLRLPGP